MRVWGVVSRLRRPEYTGENRCRPCTVLNVFFAALAAGAIALVSRPPYAFVAFVAFAVVIYLRGYLVPGTPTLTRRYLPARVLRLFGKERVTTDFEGDVGVADVLTAAGAVTTDVDGGDAAARLTDEFRREWQERVQTLRAGTVGARDVGRAFAASDVTQQSDRSFVFDGSRLVRWGSEVALVADVAAAMELRERLDGWDDVDVDTRRDALRALRLLSERCPVCDGRVSTTTRRVESCCQPDHTVVESVCSGCETTIGDAAFRSREFDAAGGVGRLLLVPGDSLAE